MRRFGWACNQILADQGESVSDQILRYAKDYISLFEDTEFEEPYKKSNLYKYFTQKV